MQDLGLGAPPVARPPAIPPDPDYWRWWMLLLRESLLVLIHGIEHRYKGGK